MKLCMLCLVFDRQVVARNMYVLFTVFGSFGAAEVVSIFERMKCDVHACLAGFYSCRGVLGDVAACVFLHAIRARHGMRIIHLTLQQFEENCLEHVSVASQLIRGWCMFSLGAHVQNLEGSLWRV